MTLHARAAQRGHVLLFAVGALALLTVLVLSLGSILRLEAGASANRIEACRARLAAEAGLERAIYLLTEHELTEPLASFQAPWVYRGQDGAGWGLDLPLELARNPSFAQGVTGAGLVYSGQVGDTHGGGDLFTLRVQDLNGRLDLNGPQPELAGMLDTLGRAILEQDLRRHDPQDPLHDPGWSAWATAEGLVPLDPVAGQGAALLRLREQLGGAFQDLAQLRALLSPERLERLRPYVTLDAWRDPNRGDVAPVNVNTAPWPVLVACLEGVGLADEPGAVDALAARTLAEVIELRRRDPLGGRLTGLDDLALLLGGADPLAYTPAVRAALANARPDVLGGAELPEDAVLAAIDLDRGDLARATVPFCFITWGGFEVSSLGRVVDRDGRVLAEALLRAVVDVYDVARLASQEDLEAARADDDPWETETFPLPVAALAGPRRFRTGQSTGLVWSNGDPGGRRWLRWQVAHAQSGWLQAAFAPPDLDPGYPGAARAHVFRLDADMQGEIWDLGGAAQLSPDRHRPLPGDVHDSLVRYGLTVGVHPDDLGLVGVPQNPKPAGVPYGVDYGADGLLARAAGEALRYPGRDGTPAQDVLGGSDVVSIRFKLGPDGDWAPLLQALVAPGATYVGLDPASGWVRVEVEARARGAESMEVRTRIASSSAPALASPPWLAAGQGPDQPLVEQGTEFALGGSAWEWHTLTLVRHANAHVALLDGCTGTQTGTAGWALPWWGPDALGTLAPGGFHELGGAARGRAALDDMVITNLQGEGGLQLLGAIVPRGPAQRVLRTQSRFLKAGPDRLGSFRGVLPRLPGPEARVGAVVIQEAASGRWGAHRFQPGDLSAQVTWALGNDPPRRQLHARLLAGPEPVRLADPYVRAWRLRRLRDRRAWLAGLVARNEAAWRRAETPPGDPASAATYQAHLTALGTELSAVEGELEAILAAHGEPAAPGGAETSAAFGPPPRLQQVQDPAAVRFQVDLLLLDQLEPGATPDQSPALVELVLPYQERPRLLREEWVTQE